ncbi:hypothetical protein JOQ06_017307 [Pogonophryne albipinna]|uniref:Uncharacterized protein n=1 Tax=Pogonophryne albipinna TaxID=1090488 RepID=A0AAD6FJJ5_9TELE|nr:hypothetical protein JOQ06_017307 [Pogonophryne albipinna]
MKPDDKWIPYKDVHLLITCETFDEAKRRETKYTSTMCPTSKIESEDEGELQQKRRSRPNPQYEHSDADDQSSGDVKRRRFAKPPEVGFPELVTGTYGNYLQSPPEQVHDVKIGTVHLAFIPLFYPWVSNALHLGIS